MEKPIRTASGKLEIPAHQGKDATGKPKINIPTDEQVKQLIEHAKHPDMKLAIELATGAGLRRFEIAALEWHHFDVEESTITVEQAYAKDRHGKLHLKPPKTDESMRTVKVMPSIMETFSSLEDKDVKHPVNLTPDAIAMKFYRLCKELGYDLRFHDLRRWACRA